MGNGIEPVHSRLDLAPAPHAVRRGRAHVLGVLGRWGVPLAITDDAELIASELLSNAVQHAEMPQAAADGRPEVARCSILLWLTSRGLTVAVYDDDRRPPVPRHATPDSEGGRGLLLVQSLSEYWGYTRTSPEPGKLVWARLRLRAREPDPGGQRNSAAVAGSAVMGE